MSPVHHHDMKAPPAVAPEVLNRKSVPVEACPDPGTGVPPVRVPSNDLIRVLVREFSHGVYRRFDPARERGSQRECDGSLGFGMLYLGLAHALEPQRVLVIGSGRGFSVACFALGVAHRAGARVTLVDPGYREWLVDRRAPDSADGFWVSPDQATAHFERHLGVHNVDFIRATSDSAWTAFHQEARQFDLIFVDGEHSFDQALRDLENACRALHADGLILAHDALCPLWPGVAAAVEQFGLAHREFQALTLPHFPGLSILARRRPLLTIRHATPDENERLNTWRRESHVTPRPLPDGDDPRVGGHGDDPRLGLFALFEGEELIGGFGLRRRVFSGIGPDDFIPDAGAPLEGVLRYGSILRADKRGRGRWQLLNAEILRWFGDAEQYCLTSHAQTARQWPYIRERVGATPNHIAYRIRRCPSVDAEEFRSDAGPRNKAALERTRDELAARLNSIEKSRCWRATAPIRWLLDRLRGVPGAPKR